MSNSEWHRDQDEAAAAEQARRRQEDVNAKEDSLLRVLAESVASVIERDPHQYSSRPCQTCRVVSGLLGRSFGCEKRVLR
jgi:hypothetical protein